MLKDLIEFLPNIHREGYLFIGIFFIATLVIWSFSESLGIIALILTIWCVCFFRDPDRVSPISDQLILSPADGKVVNIIEATPPHELGLGQEKMRKVSIFLNVFDVHVNRIPVTGKISKLQYHPGQFVNASFDKASELNERQSILIETRDNQKIAVVQIAGLIARRIVCYLDENQNVHAGERFGIIRFGSRVDLYLPLDIEPLVTVGQYMLGGETVIAKLSEKAQTKNLEYKVWE
jgi:phosphatidylserine decarboxylase